MYFHNFLVKRRERYTFTIIVNKIYMSERTEKLKEIYEENLKKKISREEFIESDI